MSDPLTSERLAVLLGRWSAGRGPLYLLLAARLRALIEEGAIAPEAALPAERRLAAHLSVGRGTVVAAYDRLRGDGYVHRRRGSGTRVAPRTLPVGASRMDSSVPGPLFLGLLEPESEGIVLTCAAPDRPPPELIDAYREGARRLAGYTGDLGYHPFGHPDLRAAVAERYTRRGLVTRPEQILITNGAQQALDLIVRGHIAAGDTVLAERPTYPGALALFNAAAAIVRTAPVGPRGVDTGILTAEMAARRPVLTYLIPSCHNPTGTVLPPLLRRRIAEVAAEHGLLVVDDETLAELTFRGDPPPPLAAFPGGEDILTLGSLSKLSWGGLRVGWVRARPGVINRLARAKALADMGNEVVSQFAAASLLKDIAGLLTYRRSELSHRHDHLAAELARWLPEWSHLPAEGGQTLWARLPHGDAAAFAQLALREGVALLPGGTLAPDGATTDGVRLPFLAPEAVLSEAVARIRTAWDRYSGAGSVRPPLPKAVPV